MIGDYGKEYCPTCFWSPRLGVSHFTYCPEAKEELLRKIYDPLPNAARAKLITDRIRQELDAAGRLRASTSLCNNCNQISFGVTHICGEIEDVSSRVPDLTYPQGRVVIGQCSIGFVCRGVTQQCLVYRTNGYDRLACKECADYQFDHGLWRLG